MSIFDVTLNWIDAELTRFAKSHSEGGSLWFVKRPFGTVGVQWGKKVLWGDKNYPFLEVARMEQDGTIIQLKTREDSALWFRA